MQSLDGNTPLFVVDGIERDIQYISAEEVESVSVLKDAAASTDLVFEEYLKYFENLNVSEEVFDREFESKTNDVIDCVSKAIKNINEKDKILEMLGKPKLEIRYFGVTKEELLKSEILQK